MKVKWQISNLQQRKEEESEQIFTLFLLPKCRKLYLMLNNSIKQIKRLNLLIIIKLNICISVKILKKLKVEFFSTFRTITCLHIHTCTYVYIFCVLKIFLSSLHIIDCLKSWNVYMTEHKHSTRPIIHIHFCRWILPENVKRIVLLILLGRNRHRRQDKQDD